MKEIVNQDYIRGSGRYKEYYYPPKDLWIRCNKITKTLSSFNLSVEEYYWRYLLGQSEYIPRYCKICNKELGFKVKLSNGYGTTCNGICKGKAGGYVGGNSSISNFKVNNPNLIPEFVEKANVARSKNKNLIEFNKNGGAFGHFYRTRGRYWSSKSQKEFYSKGGTYGYIMRNRDKYLHLVHNYNRTRYKRRIFSKSDGNSYWCDSNLEFRACIVFEKLIELGVIISYTDGPRIPYIYKNKLRSYYPDFILKLSETENLIVEIKGVDDHLSWIKLNSSKLHYDSIMWFDHDIKELERKYLFD